MGVFEVIDDVKSGQIWFRDKFGIVFWTGIGFGFLIFGGCITSPAVLDKLLIS